MNELLPIFVAVVEQRSFSKAAKLLNLSVSVVSRKIAKLEKELNVQLFQRNTRQMIITDAGQILYEHAVESIQQFIITKQKLTTLQNQVSGVLKVGAARSIVSCYIAPKLAEFVQQYPDIEVHMMNGDYMLDLLRHELDLAIHCGSLPDSNLYYKKLCIWSKATCASPAFIKKYGEPKHPSDLVNFTCLDHLYNHNRTWRYHEHGKNLWQPIRSSQRSDSSLDLKEMALNHLGFVYLPTFTVKKELESGQLINVLPAYQVPPLDMYAVYLKEKFKTKKVQAFIEFLQKQL